MARALALAVVVALVAGPAFAAGLDRYVSATGIDSAGGLSRSGLSPGSPQVLSWANDNGAAGWRIHLASGTYSDGIYPRFVGSAGNRIVYMGSSSDSAAAVVSFIKFGNDYGGNDAAGVGDYVTVKWVKTTGGITFNSWLRFGSTWDAAEWDSVHGVTVASASTILNRGHNNVLSWVRGTASRLWLTVVSDDQPHITNNTVSNVNLTLNATAGVGSDHVVYFNRMRNLTMTRTRVVANQSPLSGSSAMGWGWYATSASTVTDCYMEVDVRNGQREAWWLRDYSDSNLFTRDTVKVSGTSNLVRISFSTTGGQNSPVVYNRYHYCVFTANTDNPKAIGHDDGGRFDEFHFCVFAAKNGYAYASQDNAQNSSGDGVPYANTIFNHCTFYSGGGSEPVFRLVGRGNGSSANTGNAVRSSIFYKTSLPGGASCAATNVLANLHSVSEADSNVYFRGAAARGLALHRASSCAEPGVRDTGGVWGDPVFSSTNWPTLSLNPSCSGVAASSAWPGGFVGAYGPTSATAPDSLWARPQPPSASSRMAVVLAWQPRADGGDTTVLVRFSNRPPTAAAWWDSARCVGNRPWGYRGFHDGYIVQSQSDSLGVGCSREGAGEPEFSGNIDGAMNFGSAANNYWFGVRYAVGGCMSPIRFAYADLDSTITVHVSATPPPGGINVGHNQSGVVFWWYKPNDASAYEIRYIQGAFIGATNWDAAIEVPVGSVANDSSQPAGTIHYARVNVPCTGTFTTAGVRYKNTAFTGNSGRWSAISAPTFVGCGN